MQPAAKKTIEKVKAAKRLGDLEGAENLLRRYLRNNPKDALMTSELGALLVQRERFGEAVGVYGRLAQLHPSDPRVLSNLGAALIRNGQPNKAKAILTQAITLDPKNVEARINLGGVLQALGENKLALTIALEAVALKPSHPLPFNNLGSAFSELAMLPEAKHAFETAALLDPTGIDALINLASCESKLGNHQASIDRYEQVLAMLPAEAVQRAEAVKFFASFGYLALGNLKKGWDYYEGGFSPLVPISGARSPNRKFNAPRWNGESLKEKRLLVWAEQGVGDELLFGSCIRHVIEEQPNVIIECDPRLTPAFQRSFPLATVRSKDALCSKEDFDLQIPFASLMKLYRREIDDFQQNSGYLVADPVLSDDFRNRLSKKDNEVLVGICWRSSHLSPTRNIDYTLIDDWVNIFKIPHCRFVSLQHGDTEQELTKAEKTFNIKIERWEDVDLKNDLDKVFSLISVMDVVLSVNSTPFAMAGALGVPTFVTASKTGWGLFGKNEKMSDYPWFNSVKYIAYSHDSSAAECLEYFRDELQAILVNKCKLLK